MAALPEMRAASREERRGRRLVSFHPPSTLAARARKEAETGQPVSRLSQYVIRTPRWDYGNSNSFFSCRFIIGLWR